MPKKKGEKLGRQINVRVPEEMYDRVNAVAIALGLDASGLTRMMYTEHLLGYEERAETIKKRREVLDRKG